MKAGYYLGGLALGLIIGAGVGYVIASDPKKKEKIDDFLDDVSDKVANLTDKVRNIGDVVKSAMGMDCCDELTEEDILEIEAVLAAEAAEDFTEAAKEKPKVKK